MKSRRNHISPRFTNDPWANPHGQLVAIRRVPTKGVIARPSGPNDWGHERDLYPAEVEEALGRFENTVAPVYRLLLEGSVLNATQRHLWSHWLLCQFGRTPSILLNIAGLPEQVVSQLNLDPTANLFSSSDEAISAAFRGIIDFAGNRRLVPYLVLRDWVTYRATVGTSFIKGDNPVIVQGALIDDGTRIIYPLSPHLCFEARILGAFPPRQLQIEHKITAEQVRDINKCIAHHAEREVICTPDAESPELLADVDANLGGSGDFLRVGDFSQWPT